jgi:type VI secretion system protein ImpJ
MSWHSAVVWSQGMYLQPHHFQQEARYISRLVDERARCLSPHGWGLHELVLDEAARTLGRVGIARAVGVLPDGTPFCIPQIDAPPEPFEIPANLKNELIYLALPTRRPGVSEVDFGDAASASPHNSANNSLNTCRLDAVEEEVRDHTNISHEPAHIQIGRLKLRLLREQDKTDAYTVIGVVHVLERRSDNQVLIDATYIPPQVTLDATPALANHAQLLHGLIAQRSKLLAGRMGQLSSGVSELADFMMLQVVNQLLP